MPRRNGNPAVRRRVVVARRALTRIEWQRGALAERYARADTPQKRLAATADALIAASAAGAHQPDPDAAQRQVEALTDQLRTAVDQLHTTQRRAAERTLAAEERRVDDRAASHRAA